MPGEGPGQAEVARRPGDARLCLGPSTQQTLEPAAAAAGDGDCREEEFVLRGKGSRS